MAQASQDYIIGDSPLEGLHEAVRTEILTGRPPQIAEKIAPSRTHEMEQYTGLLLMEIIIRFGIGTLIFTNIGCAMDALFQLKGFLYYVGLQIKTTRYQSTNSDGCPCWAFGQVTNPLYDGCIMIFRSIQDQMMWIIPYREYLMHYSPKNTILYIYNGQEAKKIWDQYKVSPNDIVPILTRYFYGAIENKLVSTMNYDIAMKPTSITHKKRCIMRQRSDGILHFEQPVLNNLPYTMIWQNLKIRETPAIKAGDIRSGYLVHCCKSGNARIKYTRADFDVLLVHMCPPHESYFYFIPADVLVSRGILRSEISPGKQSFYVYPTWIEEPNPKRKAGRIPDKWAKDFVHRYQNPDIENELIILCKSWGLLK